MCGMWPVSRQRSETLLHGVAPKQAPMSAILVNHFDPWLRQRSDDRAVDAATFVGRYGVSVQVAEFSEALYLKGGGAEPWELWAVQADSEEIMDELLRRLAVKDSSWRELADAQGPAVAAIGNAPRRDVAKYLFGELQRARIHYSWPCEPFGGGLVSAKELAQIVVDMGDELERNRKIALAAELKNKTPIIEAARELKLNPQPAGHNADSWWARCPSGWSHWIMISPKTNAFGCGYCGQKGGPNELRRFCEEVRPPDR